MIIRLIVYSTITLSLTGCAIHYYDKDSQAEHLWGFGHIKMKAAPSADDVVRALITSSQTIGIDVLVGEEVSGIGLGYAKRERIRVLEDSSVALIWPENRFLWRPDFFDVRVGASPPWITSSNETEVIEQTLREMNNE